MRRLLAVKLVAVICMVCHGIASQEPSKRARLGGYVHDKDGRPWVAARVHLFSRLVPGNEWVGEADRICVISDKRGRFVAKVLRERDYLIWAVSEPVDSLYRSTRPLMGVRSGPVRLRERQSKLVQVRIRIVGDKRWQRPFSAKLTSAPQRLRLGEQRVGDPYEVFPLDLDEKATGLLPLVPWLECAVEIYDKRGVQLWVPNVELSLPARKALVKARDKEKTSSNDMLEEVTSTTASLLRLPKPSGRQLKVLDSKGVPLAGAELCQRIRGKLVFVTKSDARGVVTTQLPERFANHWDRIFKLLGASRLVVRKEGYREMPAEKGSGSGVRTPVVFGSANQRELRLQRAPPHIGRVLIEPGKPFAKGRLFLYVQGMGQVPCEIPLVTDHEGRFEFSQRIKSAWLLVALLDDATRRHLATESGFPVSRYAVLSARGNKLPGPDEPIVLSKLRRIEFSLKVPDAGPAAFAHVDAFRFSGFNAIPPMLQLRADRRGRLAILVGNCRDMLLIAQDDHGFAARNLKALENTVELTLGGMLELAGVLKDKNGRPLAEARAKLASKLLHQHNRNHSGWVSGLNYGFHFGHHFNSKSDSLGKFSLWVPEGTDRLSITLANPGGRERGVQAIEMGGKSKRDVQWVID